MCDVPAFAELLGRPTPTPPQFLHLRRLQNSIKFGAQIVGTKFHLSSTVMENHWTNLFRTSNSREQSIYTRTYDFYMFFA